MTGEWQPIETAPKDGTEIIYSGPCIARPDSPQWVTVGRWMGDDSEASRWYDKGEGPMQYPEIGPGYPTHWMPLPDPPKEQA